jgi:hypothetical protein
VLDIPHGFHVNANKAAKFSVPTVVGSTRRRACASARSYPRAVVRRLGFSKDALSLYEGRAVMRFNVSFPPTTRRG